MHTLVLVYVCAGVFFAEHVQTFFFSFKGFSASVLLGCDSVVMWMEKNDRGVVRWASWMTFEGVYYSSSYTYGVKPDKAGLVV